jgi:hypothetical protein
VSTTSVDIKRQIRKLKEIADYLLLSDQRQAQLIHDLTVKLNELREMYKEVED